MRDLKTVLDAHDAVMRAVAGLPAPNREALVPEVRTLECFHLGDIISRGACNCPAKWIRVCDLHGQCTTGDLSNLNVPCCQTCPDYRKEWVDDADSK